MIRAILSAVLTLLLLTLPAACGGDSGEAPASPTVGAASPAPTPSPSAVAVPRLDDSGDSWAFAASLDTALRVSGLEVLRDRFNTTPLECEAGNTPPLYNLTPCLRVGETLQVIDISYDPQDGTEAPGIHYSRPYTVDGALEFLRDIMISVQPGDSDRFGTGELGVFASYNTSGSTVTILTAITRAPGENASHRVAILIWWEHTAGKWMLHSIDVERTIAALWLDPRLGQTPDGWVRFDPAGPPPAATPTHVPDVPFADFAGAVNDAVATGDLAFLTDRLVGRHVICTKDNVNLVGIGAVPCTRIGDEFDVIPVGHADEGGLSTLSDVADLIERYAYAQRPDLADDFGAGSFAACGLRDDGQRREILLSGIFEGISDPNPRRLAFITAWDYRDGRWVITSLAFPFPVEPILDDPSWQHP